MIRSSKARGAGKTNGHPVRWSFRSAAEVNDFWKKFQRVPARKRRTKRDEERYCLALYLLALATHRKLKYPLRVEEGERPDFVITWSSGKTTGLEVTKATEMWVQREMTRAEDEYERRRVAANGSANKARPVGILLSERGWVDDEAETESVALIRQAIERKLPKLQSFRTTARQDLLIYDDTPLPTLDRPKILVSLKELFGSLKKNSALLGRLSVIISLDLVLDSGSALHVLPFLDWSEPQATADFGERVEIEGKKAAVTQIRRHLSEGRPVYSMDGRGRIIKQMPGGRRFEVRVQKDGEDIVVGEIGVR